MKIIVKIKYLDNLFSETTKQLQSLNIPQIFSENIDNFEELLGKIEKYIEISYKSDKDDIEDMGDIIQLLNISTYNAIENLMLSDEQVYKVIRIRVLAKKKSKYKYREFKYDGRKFWNWDGCFCRV